MSERQRGLGRGLSALLGEAAEAAPGGDAPGGGVQEIAIALIGRNPDQPRKMFTEVELEELAASIREKGVLQPILVRPAPGEPQRYQVVAGERRWRAAQRAGLQTLPAMVRALDDLEVFEIAIVENVQRADLNAVEEAMAYRALMERFGRTQDAVAQIVGKSRSHVANTLRLLGLPESVRDHVLAGRLSAGHARAIAGAHDPHTLALRIIEEGLSVRQAEAMTRGGSDPVPPSRPRPRAGAAAGDADTRALEHDLAQSLGLQVELKDRGGAGELVVRYQSLEQLDELCRRLLRGS